MTGSTIRHGGMAPPVTEYAGKGGRRLANSHTALVGGIHTLKQGG